MSWNYRIIRQVYENEETFSIKEVYYDEFGKPEGVTIDDVSPHGATFEELMHDLSHYLLAFDKPILDYSDFGKKNE